MFQRVGRIGSEAESGPKTERGRLFRPTPPGDWGLEGRSGGYSVDAEARMGS